MAVTLFLHSLRLVIKLGIRLRKTLKTPSGQTLHHDTPIANDHAVPFWPLTSQLLEAGGTAVWLQGVSQDPIAGLGPLVFSLWEHRLLTLHGGV